MLKRLGSNGNGASVGRFSCNLNVGRGTIIKITCHVIRAINDFSLKYIFWPGKDQQLEISAVLAEEGFNGCVGFFDGTKIPLYQQPASNG
jgi:hypothetical protein